MNDLGVIDHFLQVFSTYIDSGFGLLRPEVSYLTATLVGTVGAILLGLVLYWRGARAKRMENAEN